MDNLPIVPLTPTERLALSYLAHGLSNSEAAKRMDCAEDTLKKYAWKARWKLRSKNTKQAIYIATKLDLIQELKLEEGDELA